MDEQQEQAILSYMLSEDRHFVPGEVVEIPVDALVFSEYQSPWTNLKDYKTDRCIYDSETNDWLVRFVMEFLLNPGIPPVYVDILSDGIALVDGAHRVTAALLAGHSTIQAQILTEIDS